MIRRQRPGDAQNEARLTAAFAAHSGQPQAEPQEDAKLAQLEKVLAEAAQLVAQLKGGQAQEQEQPDDTGSPSEQGMP